VRSLGTVAELWLFPVKSTAGIQVDAIDLDPAGVRGDRAWAVRDAGTGELLTAAREPWLRDVRPALDAGRLILAVPGVDRPADPRADAEEALSTYLGRPVRLDRAEGGAFVDLAPVHLVSVRSMEAAVRQHDAECACSVEQPRANVVLSLPDDQPGEADLVGERVCLGGARLHVSRRPQHCLGVYADVVQPARVAVGDPLTW